MLMVHVDFLMEKNQVQEEGSSDINYRDSYQIHQLIESLLPAEDS